MVDGKRAGNNPTTPNRVTLMMATVDFLRGILRPGMTAYLCALVTAVYVMTREKLRVEDLTAEQAIELFRYIVATILYVWTTITLWWFGTRNRQQQPK